MKVPFQQSQWYNVPFSPTDWANGYRYGMGSNPFSNVGSWMGTPSGVGGNFGMQHMMQLLNNGNFPWGAPGQMGMQHLMQQPWNSGGFPMGPGMGGSMFGKNMNGVVSPLNMLGLVSSLFGAGPIGGIGKFL
jgi:hypothetical protein